MENEVKLTKTNDLETMIFNEKVEKEAKLHNEAVDKLTNDYVERMNSRIKEIEGLELMPGAGKIIVKPYGYNPYAKVEVTDEGLILGGDLPPVYKSNQTGQYEKEDAGIIVAQVIEAAPDCVYVRSGDDVYVPSAMLPLPFFNQGFFVTYEYNVHGIVNAGLTKRMEELNKK